MTLQDKRVVFGVGKDITERKQAEEHIKASLREKEVLLREIHHRVKNNMQIISGMLAMGIMRTVNHEAIGLLSDMHFRIHTMALIHSQLYKSDPFERGKASPLLLISLIVTFLLPRL